MNTTTNNNWNTFHWCTRPTL